MVKQENIKFETRLVVLKLFEGYLAEKIIAEAKDWHLICLLLVHMDAMISIVSF